MREEVTNALKRMRMDSQDRTVLQHLIYFKNGITSMEAFDRYRITRLSARIHDLRYKYDIPITTTMEENVVFGWNGNKYLERYARYTIERSE